ESSSARQSRQRRIGSCAGRVLHRLDSRLRSAYVVWYASLGVGRLRSITPPLQGWRDKYTPPSSPCVIPSGGGCGEPVSSPTCLTNCQEDAMSIVRLIQIKINPLKSETTERILKDEFASLMMSQKGFMSEKLLRVNSGEFISYS